MTRARPVRLALAVALLALGACASSGATRQRAVAPATILARGERLVEVRERLHDDPALAPAWTALRARADSLLGAEPLSVVQKRTLPPSGDRHDYLSLAPYWWPDTTKPDGRPYVRRDGIMNPESRRDHDGLRLQVTIDRAHTLALAGWFSRDERYRAAAARLLRVFFVDSATRMNPHLRYAQAIPGVTEGRGIGIIDTRTLPQLADALRLLDGAPAWTASDRAAMQAWSRAYLDWLLTSENGRDEADEENNHGTWYDAQVAALAILVGDSAAARTTLERARGRLLAQLRPDGRQPLELGRTRPIHYSIFNLEAFAALAEMGRHTGIDLWAGRAGRRMRAGLRLLAPYARAGAVLPLPEVAPVSPGEFLVPLRQAAAALGDTALARAANAIPGAAADLSRLLFDDPRASATVAAAPRGDSLMQYAMAHAAERMRRAATALDPANGYPRVTAPDGSWVVRPRTDWTSGFFAGTLWYLYQATRDSSWQALARRWTDGLEPVKDVTTTHDVGFIIHDTFGHGFLLTGDPRYRQVVLDASRSLATRYDPDVGAIRSWDTHGRVGDARREWKFPVIVDNLMNLEMLLWAARNGGDARLLQLAERHALTSARAHVRSDGSTAHVALFDPATGALERTVTWQGAADSSTWARGQAWAIHGFATVYRHTRNEQLLDAARRTADWFVAHLPADGVPYWDFEHPAIPFTERDASAAAIAASGLYDLARSVGADDARRYRAAADRMVDALASDYLTDGTPSAAVIAHAVGQRPQGVEIDVGIVYADYYFMEALLRRGGKFLD